jgi:glutamate carboxypeptidase
MTNLFPTWRHAGRTLAVAAMTAAALAIAAGRAHAEPNSQVYEKAQQYKDAALMLLARLVNIDSGTGDEQGVKAVGAIAIDELTKLGARIETFPAKPVIGDNIVVTFTGTGKGRNFLIAHMDTVFAKGTAAARPFQIKDDRAYGPGVKGRQGRYRCGGVCPENPARYQFQELRQDHAAAQYQ